jgi:hypothetical protein
MFACFARIVRLGLVPALVLLFLAPAALAQEEYPGHEHNDTNYDPTTELLIQPTANDFAKSGDGEPERKSGFGTDAGFGASSSMQVGSVTPMFHFSQALNVKLRVPYIFNRTLKYYDWATDETFEGSSSGLGDISVDVEYKPRLESPGSQLSLSGTVKLPTGDQENTYTDDDGQEWSLPLGTGSTDFAGRVVYSRSNSKMSWLGAAMFRLNTGGEVEQTWGTGTQITETTLGNQLTLSGFGRYRISKKFWANLGLALLFAGEGSVNTTTKDANGDVTWEDEQDIERSGTLMDVFPGISYALGPLNPYLGVRIPVVSSYKNDDLEINRDVTFVLQISYNPLRLVEGM